jgi:maleylpyruvate isomerase
MAGLVCCDIHPLNNLRVLQALRQDFQASEAQVSAWIARWIGTGFDALEVLIARHGGDFAFGDAATMADCCLIPQVYSAQRFGIDLRRGRPSRGLPRVARPWSLSGAHPAQQPDAD